MSDLSKIAEAGKEFACGLYKLQPGALIPTPFSDALHLVWDSFCGDPPRDPANLPPPPASPFQGGQCDFEYYFRATISWKNTDFTPPRDEVRTVQYGGFRKILNYSLEINPLTNNLALFIFTDAYNGDSSETKVPTFQGDRRFPLTVNSFTVFPSYGQADNCGSPPSAYPPGVVPPEGFTSPPTAINFNDNTVNNYTFNFTPPLAPPSNFIPPIVINVATANASFKFPMTFNFNGSINFGSGGDSNFNEGDRNNINNIKNSTNNINNSVNNVSATTNNTNSTVNNFVNTVNNKPPDPTDYNPPGPPKLPGEHEVSYLAAVEITLTAVPVNLRSQEGNAAPDVLYAGWFEFMRNKKALPRQPIHFEKGVFLAPSGVDGYAYTLYTGVQGQAVEITKKEKI
jgi:hypothetical protein